MKGAVGVAAVVALVGCRTQTGAHPDGSDGGPPSDMASADPNADADHDGWSTAQGDCNDDAAEVGPGAVELAGNGIDDDCDGMVDETEPSCDLMAVGKIDGLSLAAGLDLCDSRFLLEGKMVGPSDVRARAVVPAFGVLTPQSGAAMVLLSTGLAQDKASAGQPFVEPQKGTSLDPANTAPNPEPDLMSTTGCGSAQPATVNDYSELSLRLKAPQNAHSFSFRFQFFSSEYPEFVCNAYNDEFLVEMQSPHENAAPANISFDPQKHPITVNNGFFSVCQNDDQFQTHHCARSVSELAGTGYEDSDGVRPMGGATGWLTTSAPVTPGEELTLRFIIFDEGDHLYDSAVLIDGVKWSAAYVGGPTTIP